ncbi:hypothetical protein M1L60_16370 [Actinoplanes sp. TRM 88003]|uniref:Uncharacterized protein n=1 Tax=Paractinoplanes aksuensis TaxID=2939490 RepID=A0ABT1DQ80_9ACTN|nr:hypothetical protein [Actinoplanes aksuensis]MCO8272170.1 hypothetical protein [Actinoplanes aksuensis]
MTEIRYRRLLAFYPRDFRREYGDEMLGVLMADKRPGPAQVVDVMRGAVAAHLRGLWTGESRAARVVWIFGTMLLFAVALRRVVGGLYALARHPEFFGPPVDVLSWTRLAAWGVALAAAFMGWRVLGAAGAAAGLTGEILAPLRSYVETPATLLYAYWLIVAAALVLVAGLIADRGVARPRHWQWVVAAGALLALQGVFAPPSRNGSYDLQWMLVLVAVVLAAVAIFRQEPRLRARLLCWAAPVIATVPVVEFGFGQFIVYNMGHPESTRMINPFQWALLVLVPVAVFVGASLLDRRGRVTAGA